MAGRSSDFIVVWCVVATTSILPFLPSKNNPIPLRQNGNSGSQYRSMGFNKFLGFFVVVVVVAISWAAHAAYGGSQARG